MYRAEVDVNNKLTVVSHQNQNKMLIVKLFLIYYVCLLFFVIKYYTNLILFDNRSFSILVYKLKYFYNGN